MPFFYPPHNLSLTYLWIVLGFSFTAYTLYFRLWQDHENQSPLNFTVRTSRHVSSVVTAAAASKGRGSGTGDAGHAGVESAPPDFSRHQSKISFFKIPFTQLAPQMFRPSAGLERARTSSWYLRAYIYFFSHLWDAIRRITREAFTNSTCFACHERC